MYAEENIHPEDQDKAMAAGMDGHIAKPLEPDKMFRSICQVLQA